MFHLNVSPSRVLAALALGLASLSSHAAYRPAPTPQALQGLPLHIAPAALVEKQVVAAQQEKSERMRYAVAAPMPLTLADGVWDSPEPGIARWRLQVASIGAKTLALEFAEFSLPEGAELWLYDLRGEQLQGPYTHANESPEGKLWTALIPDDNLVLELRVAEAMKHSVGLKLQAVNHGFLSFAKMGDTSAKSGSCNIDAVCPQGDGFPDQRRAAAMLTISNSYLCSGQLVNNTRGDNRPLLLTADHCRAAENASSVISYWNYQTSSCGATPNGNLSQNVVGSRLLARDAGSDFTLLEMLRNPDPSWNVYYAGWNANGSAPQSGASFHHPQGHEKRVSLFNNQAIRSQVSINGVVVQTWAVRWSQGVTEAGSSGAALYNESRQLVGILSGGEASCANPNGRDYYARLEAAWVANADADGQLKAHLDPDNSGTMSLNGKYQSSRAVPVATTPAPTPEPSSVSQPSSGTPAVAPSSSGGGGGGSMGLGLMAALALLGLRRRVA